VGSRYQATKIKPIKMDLLKYEFMESKEGSYIHMLGQLISKLRYCRSSIPADQFMLEMPALQSMEEGLQNFDSEIGYERRNYIEEIMDELSQEDDIKTNLLDEIERSCKVIMRNLYNEGFSMADLSVEFVNKAAVYWLEFSNYNNSDANRDYVLKEVVKAMCYKFGVIFIDKSVE